MLSSHSDLSDWSDGNTLPSGDIKICVYKLVLEIIVGAGKFVKKKHKV